MKYILILLSFLFVQDYTLGQMKVSELDRNTHIKQLEQGSLIIQLPNSDKKIAALKNKGKHKLADEEEQKIIRTRKEIIEGFEKQYNFSDYYFVETEHVKEVINGNYQNVLNGGLNKIPSFPENDFVYIVRYGVGNPNGEVYRYNGIGFQVRYVNQGQLETIKSDIFFAAGSSFRLFSKKKNTIEYKIRVLNSKLKNVRI